MAACVKAQGRHCEDAITVLSNYDLSASANSLIACPHWRL